MANYAECVLCHSLLPPDTDTCPNCQVYLCDSGISYGDRPKPTLREVQLMRALRAFGLTGEESDVVQVARRASDALADHWYRRGILAIWLSAKLPGDCPKHPRDVVRRIRGEAGTGVEQGTKPFCRACSREVVAPAGYLGRLLCLGCGASLPGTSTASRERIASFHGAIVQHQLALEKQDRAESHVHLAARDELLDRYFDSLDAVS